MYEVPIYNCIRNTLKLEWNNFYLRRSVGNIQPFVLQEKDMDLGEYVREYIWWHYGIDA